jgi:hypothetical protein
MLRPFNKSESAALPYAVQMEVIAGPVRVTRVLAPLASRAEPSSARAQYGQAQECGVARVSVLTNDCFYGDSFVKPFMVVRVARSA